ncbi:hypothetical protein PHYPSEUDO_010142 [Phytophthora pseudosyringae]|uniref:M96 mating-specific protein family n=1 Tax=Phytophthora pseudosyringae TaxID=221518 RepID=A0A8T1VDP9_9STRA|nr:hypothetical protein PHYPSEUDO_010142 [Phytophthora pseudosyringae]
MVIEVEMIDADLDLEFPTDLAGLDDLDQALQAKTPTTQPLHHSLAALNRAHSLEPLESNVELLSSADSDLDEGFQAALQFLDETDHLEDLAEDLTEPPTAPVENIDTSSTSASDPEDSSRSATIAQRKPRRRHRVSAKQQIHNLRGTVEELTTQLQSLESRAIASKIEQAACQQGRQVAIGPLWQQIAARQLERRQEAERDNERLRTMLDLQIQEAKNLKRLLKRRTRIEMMEEMLGVKRCKIVDKDESDGSIGVLQELLQSTDDIYVGVDHEFETKGMGLVPSPGKTRDANRHVSNDIFLEVLEKQLVPFGPKMTGKAVWSALGQIGMQPLQCVKDVNAQVDFYAQDSQKTDDAMMISYVAATSGFRSSDMLTVRIRKVMRKYSDGGRTVFVCLMETQPQLASRRKGIKLCCTIRVVVENAKLEGDADEETTVIKSQYSVSRHAPRNENFQSYADVDMAISVWDETIARVSGEVESFLLDETATREANER